MSTPSTEPTGATPAAGTAGAIPAVLPVPTAAAVAAGTQAAGATPTTPATTTTDAAGATPTHPTGGQADKNDIHIEASAKTASDEKLAAVLKALGIGGEGASQQTPEQIAQAAQASEKAARLELAAVRNAPPNVNVSALLDSKAFSATLGALDPANGAAIQAAIVEFVKDKPQYLTVRYGAGTGDAAAAGDPGTGSRTMDDLIRGR